jgi:hypothetical protein
MMRTCIALCLAVGITMGALVASGGEKQVTDVSELAGTWRGWVSGGQDPSTMTIREDGSYQAATQGGAMTVGKYYLEDGKLRYRSSRSAGTATVSEGNGKTFLTVVPDGTDAMGIAMSTGRTEYERVKK